MANVRINLSNPVTGTYRVSFRDSSGNLLTNPQLTQNQLVNLNNISYIDTVIGNGVYTINDVTIRVESTTDNTCLDEITQNLVVNCPVSVCTVSVTSVTEQCVGNSLNVTVNATTSGSGSLQYGIVQGTSGTPSTWQSLNTFTGLSNSTQYALWVRNTQDVNNCYTVYDYVTGNCLSPCGCGTITSFTIDSITRVGTTNDWQVVFNACAFSSGNWRVKNTLGTVVVSGNLPTITSSVLTLNFGSLAVGTYLFELDSTVCLGQATKTFSVTPTITCPECFELQGSNCVPIPNCGGGGGGGEPTGTINYLLWEPDGGEDDMFRLQITPVGNGTFTLQDIGSNQGMTCYYSINGVSNPSNAKTLSSLPVPANEEIWITKYCHDSSVANINDDAGNAWQLYFYNPLKQVKHGTFIFYIS